MQYLITDDYRRILTDIDVPDNPDGESTTICIERADRPELLTSASTCTTTERPSSGTGPTVKTGTAWSAPPACRMRAATPYRPGVNDRLARLTPAPHMVGPSTTGCPARERRIAHPWRPSSRALPDRTTRRRSRLSPGRRSPMNEQKPVIEQVPFGELRLCRRPATDPL